MSDTPMRIIVYDGGTTLLNAVYPNYWYAIKTLQSISQGQNITKVLIQEEFPNA